jgi:hypothetical protein
MVRFSFAQYLVVLVSYVYFICDLVLAMAREDIRNLVGLQSSSRLLCCLNLKKVDWWRHTTGFVCMVSLFQIWNYVYDFYSTWHKRTQSEATPPSYFSFPVITGYSMAGARTR